MSLAFAGADIPTDLDCIGLGHRGVEGQEEVRFHPMLCLQHYCIVDQDSDFLLDVARNRIKSMSSEPF